MSLSPLAKPFVPKLQILKSGRYMGKPADFDDIKALFETYTWPPTVQKVYITNGWHKGYEGRNGVLKEVEYCGFAVNVDSDANKQHFYKS
ncbi:MAG TPA: hypothetical protein VH302_07555 [Bryobacteraceae bacterium]|jgi:hypothetical protein|nr:hypothetical protein [Bryobacteraceae bacterium]